MVPPKTSNGEKINRPANIRAISAKLMSPATGRNRTVSNAINTFLIVDLAFVKLIVQYGTTFFDKNRDALQGKSIDKTSCSTEMA